MGQMTLFDMIYTQYKINKPIRLIELFAGIGSQSKALENLKANFEHWKICEWAIPSILAYKEIHHDYLKNYKVDYAKDKTKEELIDYLYNLGVSSNYNEPMTRDQVKRLSEDKLRDIYNAINAENNLVNISTTKGEDLEIVETDKFDYIMSYSFPCQDLSLAGQLKGMSRNTETRSGLLWQVERLLKECKELPQILLMENVPQVIGENNIKDFQEWEYFLEKLGYKNYVEVLNAKDYGIPQNRQRCFMVSILGDYVYSFPRKQKLELRLKDMLEDNVSEKYYLSEKMINYIKADNKKWTGNNGQALINKSIASTINTGEGSRRCDASNYVSEMLPKNYDLKLIENFITTNNKRIKETIKNKDIEEGDFLDFYNKNVIKSGVAGTITTRINASSTSGVIVKDDFIPIPEATKKGYAEAHEGDGVYINRPHQKRGVVQHEMIQTLKTSPDVGVVVPPLRIRKLTPKECYRLMGFDDLDCKRASKVISDSMIYHTAGDSIVVNVLMAIFGQLM